jgi:hypothetical protein
LVPRVLLIAGIPATGKSHFCRWLAREHRYRHLDVDSVGPTIQSELDSVLADLRGIGHRPESRVVVDWGFPPECLPFVRALKDAGARLWWFDGDRERARAAFVERGTVPLPCFVAQMEKIEAQWRDIRDAFAPHLLDVIAKDGERMPPEDIWAAILARA